MLERTEYPAGVTCWIDLAPSDPNVVKEFYGGLFGWEFADRAPARSSEPYWVASLGGSDVAGIGSLAMDEPPTAAWNTYVSVDSVTKTAAAVAAAGGTVVAGPRKVAGLAEVAVFADPAGARFRVWEPAGHHGAQRVNDHGSWNWSDLVTADVDGAKTFYAAVFGWQPSSVDFGFQVATMWRVPGYGDFLETVNPGIRQMHSDGGAPDGFTDAIGWMQELADDTATGKAPHWRVTFSCDDVKGIAERAASLGGHVVVPPFSAAGSDIAVVQDPLGAVFTVSRWNG